MADAKITALSANTTPLTTDILPMVDDPGGTPATQKITIANLISASTLPAGSVVQVVTNATTGVATGTTTIPFDDTPPTSSEGTEFMTLAITPKATTNKLIIDVVFFGALSTGPLEMVVAILQDSVGDSLAANSTTIPTANYRGCVMVRHIMDAGTTSATTFKVRAGGNGASTITFNGVAAGRLYGAITKSSMTIWEYKA